MQPRSLSPFMFSLGSLFAYAQAPVIHVNPDRVWSTLETLSEFGRPVGGGFGDGVTRIGFSEADLGARVWLMEQMRESGLIVRVDPAGNLFGRRSGLATLPTILLDVLQQRRSAALIGF